MPAYRAISVNLLRGVGLVFAEQNRTEKTEMERNGQKGT